MISHKPLLGWHLPSADSTAKFAQQVAQFFSPPLVVYLSGELGDGKTLWVRSLLRALGEGGTIPSPSYALVYTYFIGQKTFHHFDFFRLQNTPAGDDLLELMHEDNAACLVEWPEMATDLNEPDVWIRWDRGMGSGKGKGNGSGKGKGSGDDDNRYITCQAYTKKGQHFCEQVSTVSCG